MLGKKVPSVVFKVRNKDERFTGENPYKWTEIKTEEYFYNKKIILFSSPGAFGPICSNNQLSDFEKLAPKFKELGMQIAAGVPLMCDEPKNFRTFRIGLFGLDKLYNVDRTLDKLQKAFDTVF